MMPLGSLVAILASLCLSLVCAAVMAFAREDYRFKAEYLLPFLVGLLGVILEMDWVLTYTENPLRNLAWNLRDTGAAYFVVWMIVQREFPKEE